ncbi:MAG: isoleucine--tRNA ligase [Armatimonadota bacterium]|nr:isoleucine--tRNA ligase [Armatimonadota bacterium]
MFKKVSGTVNFPSLEEEILQFWKANRIFEKSLAMREGSPSFVFYEGPPTANGLPHIGHVLARSYKDVIPRYKTMQGYYVPRKAGWDTHGLPVELEVEKELGLSSKRQIEEYGVERFNERCRESVFRYEAEWRRLTERIAFWLDLDNPYITFKDEYIESVWWILRQIWEKGLIYQDYKVVPYCPRCETPLSSHEVALGYQTVKDPSVYVRMRVKGQPDTSFLVWTTTPWTLPSNVALAVHPDVTYALVQQGEEKLILAKDLLGEALTGPFHILEERKGQDLVGWEYEPLFTFFQPDKKGWYVLPADFVTTTEGTGIVHLAPAYGAEDMEMGRRYDLPFFHPVDPAGRFSEEVPPWKGLFVKDADPKIIEDLRRRGLLYRAETYEHTYPFCWRCDTPLLYYAKSTWFIAMTKVKDRLLAANETINWIPEHIKEGRFGEWLRNVVDWALSRDRYWGTPLPIWICASCGHRHCVGSIRELKEMAIRMPEHFELHRPYVDEVVLRCPRCGGEMRRVPEVIDVWFDSGAMPVAQWHYPFENVEEFQKTFPADYICEGIDQTRGWFYSLLAISVLLFDQTCYRNCISLELVLDAQGQKMSKSKGNVIDPWSILNVQGADALRWYFFTASPPGIPKRLSPEAVTDVLRRFLLTLWNVYVFFVTYAVVDGFVPTGDAPPVAKRPLLDRWLLSRLHLLVQEVTEDMDRYDVTSAGRAIERFVDDLSNWYVRRGRRRYWKSENDQDKLAAYYTLYEALVTLAKLLAPFIPFTSEALYQNLVRSVDPLSPESVHLTDFPKADPTMINRDLLEVMESTRHLVSLGRAARNRAGLKVRQPLQRAVVLTKDARLLQEPELLALISDELNVKEVKIVEDLTPFVRYEIRPRFDILGPKYAGRLPEVIAALRATDPLAVTHALTHEGRVILETREGPVTLFPDEVEVRIEGREGYVAESEGGDVVVLQTQLTPDLIEEGMARELVHQIQQLRKEAGFEVADRIRLFYQGDGRVDEVIRKHFGYIAQETLAVEIREGVEGAEVTKRLDVDGYEVLVGVARIT